MTSIFKQITERAKTDSDVLTGDQCWQQIKNLTVKTLIACHQSIAFSYRATKPQDIESNLCFQILGFDIFIDKKAKPWLIEVNQSPSFSTDSVLDKKVKLGVLADAFQILSLTQERKCKYINDYKSEV